ncbi:uncharacterized protein LOC128736531 [Sabethes cyaneus]|uniref:uncharacterized protein LOC128736531 n=1 Tax=Sabethes cyaneus TaxID=53552 RepID=UPI00237E05DF|nr:uncharacterized protein LOC128736531 [Sabethes cyaneus]
MGIFHSKVAPSETLLNPLNLSDPRSPTVNINRSPIGTVNEITPDKSTITKVRDLTTDLTEILDSAQTPTAEKLQSVVDPRSPSFFLRTPLILNETDASNISLQGSSIEYEEISSQSDISFSDKSLSFKECDDSLTKIIESSVVTATEQAGSGSIFSDTSLNTELEAQIDCIIQGLYDAGKDPRSPSIQIQRTPIVFEEDESKIEDKPTDEENEKKQGKQATEMLTIIHQNENQLVAPVVTTPNKEKLLDNANVNVVTQQQQQRTPLGCVTNVKAPSANAGSSSLRKTALLGQMKQNVFVAEDNADAINGKRRSLPRSKIPTLRMK